MLAGWGLSKQATRSELALQNDRLYGLWRLLVRFVVPVAIALVFIVNL